jgi:hypothetical protein
MSRYAKLASLFRNLIHRRSSEQELDAELNSYIAEHAERNAAGGMNAGNALRQARLEAGGVQQLKEKVLAARAGFWLQTFLHDLRYAARVLSKSPATTLLVLCLLGIGIGANTAIFSLLNALYFKAVPVPDSSRVVRIYAKRFRYGAGFSKPEYLSLRERMTSLAGVAAETQVAQLHLVVDSEPREVEGFFVTSNYTSLLDLRPSAGRFFLPEEDAAPEAIRL